MHILFTKEKSTETNRDFAWFMLMQSKSMKKMSASHLINLYVKPCSSLIEIISQGKRSDLNDFGIQPK